MKFLLVNSNITVVAKEHNPSIISQEWLVKKKLLTEKVTNFAHTPVFSVVETDNFDSVVDPERLFLNAKKTDSESLKRIQQIAIEYTHILPEIPYKVIEMRFIYEIAEKVEKLKDLFIKNDEIFKKVFSEEYKIGGTISFNFSEFLVKARFSPMKDKVIADISYSHNFKEHPDFSKILPRYFELLKHSEKNTGGFILIQQFMSYQYGTIGREPLRPNGDIKEILKGTKNRFEHTNEFIKVMNADRIKISYDALNRIAGSMN